MRIRHLQYYIAVAEELSFANAAKRVHIHPSPLAQAIRNIEHEFGTVLFERPSGRLKLTWAGEVFLHEARRIIFVMNNAKATVASAGTGYRGRLRIALAHSLAQPLFTKLLALCRAEEPLTGIRIFEMSIAKMVRALNNDEIDAGFTLHSGLDHRCCVKEAVWTDKLVLALPSRHTLLVYDKIAISEVLKHPIIACHPEKCAGGHELVNRWLRQFDCSTEPIIAEYVSNLELMMVLVGAGYGLGLPLASQIALHSNPDVVIRETREESAIATTFIIRSDRAPSPELCRFIERAKLIGQTLP